MPSGNAHHQHFKVLAFKPNTGITNLKQLHLIKVVCFLSQIQHALDDVDLKDQADVFAKKLSGGQKRKLSVALALIGDPKVSEIYFTTLKMIK